MNLQHLISSIDSIKIDSINISGKTDIDISGIHYDSRKCRRDSLFVAVKGELADGHNYIEKAIRQGARCIVCEKLPDEPDPGITYIKVADSRIALAQLSHAWHGFPSRDMAVIGVTGTNGKTTVTFLLKSIFDAAGKKAGIIGTTGIYYNNKKITASHTTPESLEICGILNDMKQVGIDTVIMEVSSHALVQHRTSGIDFDAAVFTNLTHEHLDYHKTFDDYASAKRIIFESLGQSGVAIVNSDSEYAEFMLAGTKANNIIKVGRKQGSTQIIRNENLALDSSSFELEDSATGESLPIHTPLTGRFNIENAAISAAAGLAFGVNRQTISEALSTSTGAPGRMQRINLKSGAIAIVDYAHTPDALAKALKACRDAMASVGDISSKLISVFGCGGDRDKTKRPIMGKISTGIANFTIITDDNPRTENPEEIINDILQGVDTSGDNFKVVHGREKAIEYAVGISSKNDIILVAGKGHEDYQIVGTVKHHFDDAEVLARFC